MPDSTVINILLGAGVAGVFCSPVRTAPVARLALASPETAISLLEGERAGMDSALISVFVNTGVAGVVAVLFILGFVFPKSVATDLKTEITELKEALEYERDRANTAVAAASATRDLLAAIQIGQGLKERPGP